MDDKSIIPAPHNFIFYTTNAGALKIGVTIQDQTVWLTQQQIADLFERDRSVITKHLKNIFDSGELDEGSNVQKMHFANSDKPVILYNLDVIISVGYRVNSQQATQFRIWATKVLKEFLIKGFALDDERLEQAGQLFGKDYFDELLERIREIRASERRFYQKITDIYAQCSADYDPGAPITQDFYAAVQNKLHWAITGKTAAEIIYSAADAAKVHMGLTTWKNAPAGKILKSDSAVAKNYLSEQHIKELNRIVSAYLDLAENRAERHILMSMADWVAFLDRFLELSDYPILSDKGKVGALEARLKAAQEYENYRLVQDQTYLSDFDKQVKHLTSGKSNHAKHA
jgi:hypothetical protein